MTPFQRCYRRAVLAGILANFVFVVPLVAFPVWFLGLLKIPLSQPIWAQAGGLLLFIISIFYIPGALDPVRYRAMAWMHVFPSRAIGATFFSSAVLFFGQPLAYLSIAVTDALFGLLSLHCLIGMLREEVEAAAPRHAPWVGWLISATAIMVVVGVFGLAGFSAHSN